MDVQWLDGDENETQQLHAFYFTIGPYIFVGSP